MLPLAMTASEVNAWVTLALALVALAGVAWAIVRRIDKAADVWRLVQRQVAVNGAAERAGTQEQTLREVVDNLTVKVDERFASTEKRLEHVIQALFDGARRNDERFAAVETRQANHEQRLSALASRLDRLHRIMRDHDHKEET